MCGPRGAEARRRTRSESRQVDSGGWQRDLCIGEPGATRYGEASHPGPLPNQEELPLQHRPPSDDLEYPEAHRDGFRAIRTAGFEDLRGNDVKAGQQFALVMETANTTGWNALKRRLGVTAAHVVFAQETRVRARDIPLASSWALRNGWQSMWSPATRGRRGGSSAGVAVFVKEGIGMRSPPKAGHNV